MSPARPYSRLVALFALCAAVVAGAAKTEVPLILMSGQSNMVGLGTATSDLSAAQKAFFPDTNIKVYLDAEGQASLLGKWSTLNPVFGGATAGQGFGPELFFGKTLNDSFPGRKFAFIKVARSGTYLGKTDQWIPPSSNNGTGGPYYTAMMASIDAALKNFNSAFDTSKYTPKWAGFVWLQGEFDAMDQTLANSYETNLTNLVKDIRTKAATPDLPIILPMIDVQSTWTYNAKVRAADVALTTKLTNVDTMDTKGLPTNNIHYLSAGMVTIGIRSAQRWLKMKYLLPSTAIDPDWQARRLEVIHSLANTTGFDVFGRRTGVPSRAGSTLVRDPNGRLRTDLSAPSIP
jgi:hypothetical protein